MNQTITQNAMNYNPQEPLDAKKAPLSWNPPKGGRPRKQPFCNFPISQKSLLIQESTPQIDKKQPSEPYYYLKYYPQPQNTYSYQENNKNLNFTSNFQNTIENQVISNSNIQKQIQLIPQEYKDIFNNFLNINTGMISLPCPNKNCSFETNCLFCQTTFRQ